MIDLQSTIKSLQLYLENQEKSIELLKESLKRHEIHNKKSDAKIQELERKIKVLSSSSSSSSINNVTPTRQSKDDSSTSPYQNVLPSKHRTSYRDVLVQKCLYSMTFSLGQSLKIKLPFISAQAFCSSRK
ncbi:hypothetical protein PoB_000493400 [Plakobranchus ocellatus]|uniref:Uncharacterized protein n=1 Tax=Plakobranchus ocellatus TaxID=259542 RepID=A0AAV3Y8N7_9GAST|nr:hypothetical protein PoB_000493400 [Plakobranchus ocellatus]